MLYFLYLFSALRLRKLAPLTKVKMSADVHVEMFSRTQAGAAHIAPHHLPEAALHDEAAFRHPIATEQEL